MPAFTDHYKNPRQYRNTPSSSLPSKPLPITAPAPGASALGGGNAFGSSRARIYPREYNSRHTAPRSPHLSNTASPLLSALPNATDLFPRSIPFASFLSSSTPSTNGPNSLGSASGGVGLGVGVSPPPSGPASYSSGGNYSGSNGNPRQIRGYPGFEEQFTNHSAPGSNGYYNPSQRYAVQGSPIPLSPQFGGLQPQLQPGEGNYACSFDTLDEPFGGHAGATTGNGGGSGGGDNVLCLGWEGGVDVWKVGRGVLEQVGRLEGLGGGVKSAKILPTPPRNDPLAAHRPLICLTIHSSVVPIESDPPIVQETETPYSTSPPSRPSTSASNRSGHHSPANATDWQTRVEIWSLSSRKKIASLFTSPVVPSADFGFGIGGPPPPWGGLRVEVTGTKVVVGVGISGELYIFGLEDGVLRKGSKEQAEWRCLGKVWTCVQTNHQGSFSVDSGIAGNGFVDGTPVFSISNGWLAYCPASAGSSVHAGGEVDAACNSPSVTSQCPPIQPSLTVAVSAEDEALLNRFTREVTQEFIRGAKWATETGKKALQSYWNGNQNNGAPPPPAPPLPIAGINGGMYGMPNGSMISFQGNSQPSGLGQQLRQMQQMGGTPPQTQFFQNTAQQPTNEPRLVGILDLNKILHGDGGSGTQQGSITPMATFLPQGGVSYLSFAPGGLALLTASTKGDSLFVWDLMRAIHHPPGNPSLGHKTSASLGGGSDAAKMTGSTIGAPDPAALGKHVRQIARFNRLTVATIVDVGWSSPRGEKLTVVTEKGTVHFYDLPSGAYQWPPPRKPPPSSSAVTTGGSGGAAGAAVSGAVNLLSSSTQPLLSAARRRRSGGSSGSPSGGIFVNGGAGNPAKRGGQSNSNSGSPNDNSGIRVSLPQGFGAVTAGCVRFLVGKERGYVAMNGGGVLRIYEVKPGGGGSKKRQNGGGVVMNNYLEYELPLLPDGSQQQQQLSIEGEEKQAGGYWSGRYYHHRSEEQTKYDQHPLSFAEIETNAVFPPFHTDRHVRLFVYTDNGSSNQLPQQHPQRGNDWQHDETRQDTQHKRRGKRGAATPAALSPPVSRPESPTPEKRKKSADQWVFGLPLPAEKLNIGSARGEVEFAGDEGGLAEAMASHLKLEGTGMNGKKKIVGKKGRRVKGGAFGTEIGMDEGFFEDDCEVLEYTGN
ncbi:uncharacterized protein H6S33_009347 [Morchella sextelata]|uniref:uncharacterized protein n=1 Tax=Morchella sextelata TaxID=1174677 RepID=UPI001D03C114|nr:uncharacterized protein H6S33_009347 [Morchella sextelata]KAH0612967.1 hypothetical protein H6S33_009347 [Morchella sextelata]